MDFTKKQKFSIRKLTLGVASILIGTSLVFGSQEVNAQESVTNNQSSIISEGIQIDYLAVDEEDLTTLEKSVIRYEDISEEIASKNDTYILVYQNKSLINHQLPRTGSETGLLSLLAAGAVLLVVYRLGKKKSLLLGVVVLTTTASVALSNKGNAAELLRDLAHHVSTYSSGQSLNALVIDGYDYVGYIRDEDVPTETALFNLVSSYKGLMVTEKQNDHVDKPLLADHLIKPDTSVLENGEDNGNLAFTPSSEEVVPEVITPSPVPEEVVPEDITPSPVPEEVAPEVITPSPVPEEVAPEVIPPTSVPEEVAPEVIPPTPVPEEVAPEVIIPAPVPEEVAPEVIPPTPVPEEVVPEVIPPTPVPEEVFVPSNPPIIEDKPALTLPESKVVTRVLNFDTVYVADSEKDYDSSPEMMSEGKSGLETTTISYTLSNEGEVIENSPVVDVVEPQSQTIKIGTKPTVKLEDVPFTTRYIGDDSLEKESQKEETAGTNGVITTKTTYTLNSKTGQVTMTTEAPQITKPMVERIVKVGTKPTLVVEEIAFDTEYRSDETKSVGNDVTSGGKVGRKEVRTTYRVDEQTGKLTQDTVESRVLEQPVTRIITKGTKPEVVTTAVPYETEYVADEELEVGTVSAVGGEVGENEVVTTYDVDKATGKMTAIAGDEREVKAPTKKVVTKGTKPSVRTEEQDFSTRYIADESLTKGEQIEETPGKKQVTTFTKTYSLDKVTGNVVANSETSRVTTTMQERVVKVGTKSTSRVTTKLFTIRYESDDTMPKGEQRISVKGVEEVTTHTETYALNTTTGVVTANPVTSEVTTPMVEQVVKVGTKPTLAVEEIAFDTEYRSDETKSVGNDVTSGGKVGRKEVRTTYRVDEQTGKLTQDTVESRVLEQPVTRIITKGTKPEVVTTAVPYETEYVADEELEVGTVSAVGGEAGEKEVVTTYDVDKATGKMTAIAGDEREVKAPTKKVVTKGTKPSVRTEEQDFSTLYIADESLTKGEQIEETPGKKQVTTFTKTYSLDKVTGNVVANSETSRVTTTMQERVVKVGTKSTSRVTTKPFTIRYESDDTMPKGEQRISVKGVEEVTTHTETYALNTTTGVVTANPITSEVTTPMVEQVVKVGTRPILTTSEVIKEDGKRYSRTTKITYTVDPKTGAITEYSEHKDTLIPEDKVKPEIEVTKVTTDEDTSSATVTYRKSDPSQTFRKISVKLYDEQNQVIKIIDSNTLEDLNLVLTELKPYVTYKVETTVHYDLDKGEETEVLEKKEIVEIIPKRIEFRNVSSKALYKVSEDGSMSIVTGLASIPNDKQNYLVKIVNDGREVVLPVASFAQKGDKIAVTVEHPKLVTFVAPTETTENYTLEIEKTVTGDGIYTSFDDLIRDMKTNSRDVYRLGSDLHATDTSDLAYVPNFTKKLTSVDGKQYAIIGLKKPLINTLSGGTVENVILKDVNITSNDNIGSIAMKADVSAKITKVIVNGRINYISNSASTKHIGGLVGDLSNSSSVTENYVDINISASGGYYNNISGLVGKSLFSTITKNFIKSKATITDMTSPYVASVLASDYASVVDNNIIFSTNDILGGGAFSTNSTNNKKVGQDITQEAANAKLKEWGLIKEEAPSPTPAPSNQSFDYAVAKNYQANRMTAYRNMEKLLPVYDRHTIVKYGNLVPAGSLLATKVISSVTPMTDGDFNVNLLAKDQPNKLFIRYDDNTSEIVNLTQVGPFKNTDVIEYNFNNDLLFTLAQFNRSETTLVDKLKAQLSPIELNTEAIKLLLKIDDYNSDIRALNPNFKYEFSVNDLYLDQSFAEVKANLDTILSKLLSNNDLTYLNNDTVQKTIVKKVSDNKEKIMLGLAYLNRLYGIHYDTFNIKDLVMLNPRFYGKEIDNIDVLIELGSQGFENLMLHNNLKTFEKVLANKLDSADLLSFLDKNRTLLTTKSANEWFRSSTKAFTHEVASTVLPDANVEIYTRLQQKGTYKTYILPLLNLKADDVYVITTLSTIYFGGYGRSVDNALKQSDPSNYRKQVAAVHDELKKASSRWGAYNDFYLKISSEPERSILKTKYSEVFDGYYIKDSKTGQTDDPYFTDKRRWATRHDKDYNAIYDFFGPIGRWYSKSEQKNSAYAIREDNRIHFDYVDLLGGQGGATLNHELVHAYDEDVLLQGHKYRDGQSVESYAYGLLESVSSANSYYFGFNFMYDIDNAAFNPNISRFNNKQDLQDYMKGLSDVSYLLDGLEAEVIVTKSADQQAQLLRKMEMKTVLEEGTTHANDIIKNLSTDEMSKLKLRTVSDFVDNDLVAKTSNMRDIEYFRDKDRNYYTVPLYYPIYAAYQNNQGTVGGLMFRRVLFDMLSEYGWDKGFVGYASNQHKPKDQVMTDEIAFKAILDAKYNGSYKDFKKDMFAQRLAKQDQIKAITIRGQQVTSGQELKDLLQKALDDDLAKGLDKNFARQTLKAEIFREFSKVTNNFRTSIFK